MAPQKEFNQENKRIKTNKILNKSASSVERYLSGGATGKQKDIFFYAIVIGNVPGLAPDFLVSRKILYLAAKLTGLKLWIILR
ncbi:MAG: hypothetical protein IPM98_06770 [Lewinellaceae bacterium]|nr:hypothetical protein [Lewinellaceae bacterium]